MMPLEPKCSFRVMGLSDQTRSELIGKHLNGVDYLKGSSYKDRYRKSLIILLNETTAPEILRNLINGAPDGATYDFFVSVSSGEQTAIIEIPRYVLDLHNDVGGQVNFSYTCTFDPDRK